MDMLGEYITVCLVFVVLALLEFALIVMLNRNSDGEKTPRTRKSSLEIETNANSTNHGVKQIAFVEDHSMDTCLSDTADQELTRRTRKSSFEKETNATSTNHGVTQIAFVEDHSTDTCLSDTSDQELANGTKRGMRCISSISPIHAIDFAAAFIFPLAFVVYNCFYWSRTLDEGELNG